MTTRNESTYAHLLILDSSHRQINVGHKKRKRRWGDLVYSGLDIIRNIPDCLSFASKQVANQTLLSLLTHRVKYLTFVLSFEAEPVLVTIFILNDLKEFKPDGHTFFGRLITSLLVTKPVESGLAARWKCAHFECDKIQSS